VERVSYLEAMDSRSELIHSIVAILGSVEIVSKFAIRSYSTSTTGSSVSGWYVMEGVTHRDAHCETNSDGKP
jgi:hypothetical protein